MKMHCNLRVCFWLGLALSLSLAFSWRSAQAQPTPGAHNALTSDDGPADLTKDARLDRHITLHDIGTPLDALLLRVSSDDLKLSCDRNCDTLELQLNLLNRPLRHLMQSLAELAPGAWYKTPSGKGYVLMMSWTAVRRRQRWWDLYLAERQRVLDAMPGMVLKEMQARPRIKGEVSSADGNVEGFKEMLLAGPTFFNLLPASLQEQIAGHINEISLLAGMWCTGMDEGAIIVPFTDLPAQAQARLSSAIMRTDRPPIDLQENGYVLCTNTGNGVHADLVDATGASLGAGFGMDIPIDSNEPIFPLDHSGLLWRVQWMKQKGQDIPLACKEFIAYQQSRVWPNALPPKGYNTNSDRISDLEKMAEEDHMEFVSDYYSLPVSYGSSTPLSRLSQQTREELNRLETRLNVLAANADLSWKQTSNKIYVLRNNRWYRDDRLEVPASLLQRWLEQDAREWAKEPLDSRSQSAEETAAQLRRLLDWQAEVVSTLTPWQIFHGLQWATVPASRQENYLSPVDRLLQEHLPIETKRSYAPFERQVIGLTLHYHLMLFYASLSVEQRTALLQGDLDFSSLTADQQQQAIYLQPRLQICLSRHVQPILLEMLHRAGPTIAGDSNVHLIIATPTMSTMGQNGGR